MARILVTGASGFVGASLFERLRSEGHDVYGTTTANPTDRVLYCNIEDVAGVAAVFSVARPEIVIHCAAISSVTAAKTPSYYLVNTVGTENVVKQAAEMEHRVRFVLVSTAGVYGNQDTDLLHEGLCPKPVHHYGMSKLCCERLIANFVEQIDYSIVRPFNIIGEGQNREFIVPKLVDAFYNRDAVVRLGNLDVYRDYIDLADAVDIIDRITFDKNSYGETYNLCSGRPVSLQQLIQTLRDITNHDIDVEVAPEFVRKNEVWRLLGDVTKLEALLGKPLELLPMEQSLRRMVAAKSGKSG